MSKEELEKKGLGSKKAGVTFQGLSKDDLQTAAALKLPRLHRNAGAERDRNAGTVPDA